MSRLNIEVRVDVTALNLRPVGQASKLVLDVCNLEVELLLLQQICLCS